MSSRRLATRARLRLASPVAVVVTLLLLGLAAGGSIGSAAQGTPGTPVVAVASPVAAGARVFELPGDAVYPEGVTYDEENGVFYVTSAGDGTIFQGDIETGDVEVFSEGGADGRTTAAGIKVDADGLLYVAGGQTGLVSIYDTADGSLVAQADNGLAPETFANDIALVGDVAYVTDSFNPFVDAVTIGEDGEATIATAIDFTGTAFEFQAEGFNANGIVATADGQYLLVVQTATGGLFRIDVATGEVVEVDLGGADLTNGDGMALDGQTLYVVRNQNEVIAQLDLSDDFASATFVQEFTDPTFAFPTTLALTGDGRALVVNSQFDRRQTEDPELPFTVSLITLPGTGPGATPVVAPATPDAPDAAVATVPPPAPTANPAVPPVASPST